MRDSSPAFTLGDLKMILTKFPRVRRKALLFALEGDAPMEDTVMLRWSMPVTGPFSPLALQVIASTARHIKVDYVFWEFDHRNQAQPLFFLEDDLETKAGLTLNALRYRYRRALPYDSEADVIDLAITMIDL